MSRLLLIWRCISEIMDSVGIIYSTRYLHGLDESHRLHPPMGQKQLGTDHVDMAPILNNIASVFAPNV